MQALICSTIILRLFVKFKNLMPPYNRFSGCLDTNQNKCNACNSMYSVRVAAVHTKSEMNMRCDSERSRMSTYECADNIGPLEFY